MARFRLGNEMRGGAVLGGGGSQKVQDVWVGGGDVGARVGGVYRLGAGEGVAGSGEGGVE